MLKIAVCDDDAVFVKQFKERLQHYLKQRSAEARIMLFTNACEFLKSPLDQYEIVFLDVKINENNGMDVARQLQEQNTNAMLIFVSAYVDFAPKGYELNAFRYLTKENLDQDFTPCIRDAMTMIEAQRQSLYFKTTDGKGVTLPLADIYYIESQDHNILVHTKQTDHLVHDAFGTFTAQITCADFMLVQRSFFVNLRNAIAIQGYKLELRDKITISISRKSKAAVMKRFLMIQGEC